MSSIPPKQAPDTAAFDDSESGGGMVAMYNAASHANAESFPVLKAFQDYLEAERTQARKRVIQLSVFFSILMGVVVTGFLIAGGFMVRNMSSMQDKLLDIALANRTAAVAPAPVVQTSPVLEESVKQMSRATTELQADLGKKLDGVSEMASQVHEKVASQDGELAKLRDELRQMQEQSAKLKDELVAVKTESRKPVISYTAPPPRPTPVVPPPVPVAETAVGTAAPAPTIANAPTVAVAPAEAVPAKPAAPVQPATQIAASSKQGPRDPRFPPATKAPPVPTAGVTPPAAPKGMMATALPISTKNVGTIPWRVLIPE